MRINPTTPFCTSNTVDRGCRTIEMSQQERLSNDEVFCIYSIPQRDSPINTDSTAQFLTRLTTLLADAHSTAHGSIYLTQKPVVDLGTADAAISKETDAATDGQILIRATNGLSKEHRGAVAKSNTKSRAAQAGKSKGRPKVKLATVVNAVELDAFYARYAEVCKKGMEGLRKRDKKKAKVKAKAKKKGKGGAGAAKTAS